MPVNTPRNPLGSIFGKAQSKSNVKTVQVGGKQPGQATVIVVGAKKEELKEPENIVPAVAAPVEPTEPVAVDAAKEVKPTFTGPVVVQPKLAQGDAFNPNDSLKLETIRSKSIKVGSAGAAPPAARGEVKSAFSVPEAECDENGAQKPKRQSVADRLKNKFGPKGTTVQTFKTANNATTKVVKVKETKVKETKVVSVGAAPQPDAGAGAGDQVTAVTAADMNAPVFNAPEPMMLESIHQFGSSIQELKL